MKLMNFRKSMVLSALIFAWFSSGTIMAGNSPAAKQVFIQYSVYACSEYTWVVSENQRVCISANRTAGDGYRVTAYRECQIGVGTCPNSPFGRNRTWCYATGEGQSGIVVGNKNRFMVDLDPEDCEVTLGDPQGAQLIAESNGVFESITERESSSSRYEELGKQCWSRTDGGTREARSADISATIDGWDIETGGEIVTYHEFGFRSNCSH